MAGAMATLSSSYCALASAPRLSSPAAAAGSSSSSRARQQQGVIFVSSGVDNSEQRGAAGVVSRRQAVSLTALSVFLLSSQQQKAQARDIPLFGLKRAKKLTDEVVQDVKNLVKEGESEASAVGGAISGAVKNAVAEFPGASLPNIPSVPEVGGLSPALQAGAVVGAELVAVLVASTVVNGLVSTSK